MGQAAHFCLQRRIGKRDAIGNSRDNSVMATRGLRWAAAHCVRNTRIKNFPALFAVALTSWDQFSSETTCQCKQEVFFGKSRPLTWI